MVALPTEGAWKCVSLECGAPSASICGTGTMPWWPADSWESMQQVRRIERERGDGLVVI